MDLGIDGRTALVMGASQGIGRAIATTLAAEGARVALVSRSAERLGRAAEQIEGETATFTADTTDPERLADLVAEVAERLGPVEILVLNTGGPPGGAALDHEAGQWREAYDSLVSAPRVLCEACLPAMREAGWGRIVNVASTSVTEPIPGLTLSTVHRMAAVGFLRTLAREVAAEGITANTVATGRFATARLAELYGSLEAAEAQAREDVPAARLGSPEEFGDLVAFLCSERASFLTGAVVPLDGGMMRSG